MVMRKASEKVVCREFPGHTISVCRGDKIVVDLTNKLPSETTTMHWHGQYMHGDIEGEGEGKFFS